MRTIKTSNGALSIDHEHARAEIGGVAVDLGEVAALERPEDGYTHLVSYSGVSHDGSYGISGSSLISADDAQDVARFIEEARRREEQIEWEHSYPMAAGHYYGHDRGVA